jgi:hypothetical protein
MKQTKMRNHCRWCGKITPHDFDREHARLRCAWCGCWYVGYDAQNEYLILYTTHRGGRTIISYPPELRSQVALKLGRLWQARMEAVALDPDGNCVGEVFKRDGKLTWWASEVS